MARGAPRGVLLAVAAYTAWGVTPIYFYAVRHVPALELTLHRVFFAALLLAVALSLRGRWRDLLNLVANPRIAAGLACTAALIGANWLAFVWGVQNQRNLEISLGYFTGPLLNLVLGLVVLRERLSQVQRLAALLACLAVASEFVQLGQVPGLALFLAVTFGFYALIRKRLGVPSDLGLSAEMGGLALLGSAGLAWLACSGDALWPHAPPATLLLIACAGPVTVVPLMLFTAATASVPLVLLGLLQYIAPCLLMVFAVTLFGETVAPERWWTFSLIWCGLALLTGEPLARARARRLRLQSLRTARADR